MDQAINELETARKELSETTKTVDSLKGSITEIETINADLLKEIKAVTEKERKSSRLVQELEEQLSQNFDQHAAATNRLSALQGERSRELEDVVTRKQDLEKEVEQSRIQIALLEVGVVLNSLKLGPLLINSVSTRGCEASIQHEPRIHGSSREPPEVEL
jgi:kinesin family protein 4/21/27